MIDAQSPKAHHSPPLPNPVQQQWSPDTGETMNTRELIAEAKSLPVEERALVVDSLLQSLNQPDSDVDKQWTSVAQRRLAELRTGGVAPVPGDEVFARIWKRFGR